MGARRPPSLKVNDRAALDERFMAAALALGRRGLGRAAPNPAVGALIVRDGVVVGRGFTAAGGRPHAERSALDQAGHLAKGATIYVTLEPCAHQGRGPPCAAAIVEAGIACVVSAMEDPDPRTAGQGHALLRRAGIEVAVGVGAAAARRDHLGHILRVSQNRPAVTLKLAQTADGFAAGARYDPRLAITGEAANSRVQILRAMHDAIMIGIGTALGDDPLLTVRFPGAEARPLRVVLDPRLSLPPR
ncbi:MAG TPA: bifunctional diaminohydroxyphosphoribosylaminopyrimidine deaminase/5-amino-6-(5-phosphoribosylamino)uracil reductase RibD, partial [Roseiarcus sp.]|nr:bifunctional diaminohydroxyphosphoribosylaminopyrimidine deaminase/5-amino-6-(5-phosphoribosylamino)uracil reductase RibD [Roseiarcus sp.]